MAVTEFALLRLTEQPYDDLEFLETLTRCLEVQDDWVAAHQPSICKSDGGNQSHTYLSKGKHPRTLLITAPWETPSGHHDWLGSDANKQVMQDLAKFCSTENGATVVFHLNPAGKEAEMGKKFAECSFKVHRVTVEADQRSRLEDKYRTLEQELVDGAPKTVLWAGWRIEKESDKEELVVFWGASLPSERLSEFAEIGSVQDEGDFVYTI